MVSFGTNLSNAYRQLGTYAGKVLQGSKPGDLPVIQQSDKVELAVNLKTAEAMGLAVPLSILARAEELIE